MYINVQPNWEEINSKDFEIMLESINWKRDDLGYYIFVSNNKKFAIEIDEKIYLIPQVKI